MLIYKSPYYNFELANILPNWNFSFVLSSLIRSKVDKIAKIPPQGKVNILTYFLLIFQKATVP